MLITSKKVNQSPIKSGQSKKRKNEDLSSPIRPKTGETSEKRASLEADIFGSPLRTTEFLTVDESTPIRSGLAMELHQLKLRSRASRSLFEDESPKKRLHATTTTTTTTSVEFTNDLMASPMRTPDLQTSGDEFTPMRGALAKHVESLNIKGKSTRLLFNEESEKKRLEIADSSIVNSQDLITGISSSSEFSLQINSETQAVFQQFFELQDRIDSSAINNKRLKEDKSKEDDKREERSKMRDLKKQKADLSVVLIEAILQALMNSEISCPSTLEKYFIESLALTAQEYKRFVSLVTLKDAIKKYSFSEIIKLLYNVSQSFAFESENIDAFLDNVNNKSAVAAILQLRFEALLKSFNISSFTPLKLFLDNPSTKPTRIILVCGKESVIGFGQMRQYLQDNKIDAVDALERLKTDSLEELTKKLNNNNCKHFETAWTHLAHENKSIHDTQRTVFVTSIEGLKLVLESCSYDSTLVIRGHGGGTKVNICDEDKKGDEHLKVLNSLLNDRITHLILSSCSTGLLNKDVVDPSNPHVVIKHQLTQEMPSEYKYRNRMKIFVENPAQVLDLFDKLSDGDDYVAAKFADSYFNNPNCDSERGKAFTFCPSLIVPMKPTVSFGVPLSEKRIPWPDFLKEWEQDDRVLNNQKTTEQIAWKSMTMYDNYKNKKAPVLDENKNGKMLWNGKSLPKL